MCFLVQLTGPCARLTDEQIEADQRQLVSESKKEEHMLKWHATVMLKSLSFLETSV